MDDYFRKAAGEQHFSYKPEFWNDVEAQLNDDSLDTAFKIAAGHTVAMPDMDLTGAIDDAFLDDAFKSAAENAAVDYPANAWNSFLSEAPIIEQDIAFNAAANSVTADYHPAFWSDADQALQNEGLHYEYKSAYWNEARNLLDHADRKVFFFRWSAVAAVLLLVSFGGIYQLLNGNRVPATLASHPTAPKAIFSQFADAETTQQTNLDNTSNRFENQVNEHVAESNNTTHNYTHSQAAQLNSTQSFDASNNVTENRNDLTGGTTGNDPNSTENNQTGIPIDLANTAPQNQTDHSAVQTGIQYINEPLLALEESDLNTNLLSLPTNTVNELNQDVVSAYSGPPVEIKRFSLAPTHTLSFIGNAGVGNKYGVFEFTPTLRTSFGIEYKRTGFGRLRNFEFGGTASLNHVRQNDFGTEGRVSVFNLQGGVDKFWYKLQLKDMIYANVSGLASYRLNAKNSLRVSLGVDYLVFVQSNMSYKVKADEEITTVNNNWGVKEGLNKLDLRFGFGYEYAFTQRFTIQMNGSFGFFDRSDNEFISDNTFDHEMNATVGLKYTFLRKL